MSTARPRRRQALVGLLFALLAHDRELYQHRESTIMHATTKSSRPAHPTLVTGAVGRVGAVGQTIAELLLKQGKALRAMVRNEDERPQALRDRRTDVVVGNLNGTQCRCETQQLNSLVLGTLGALDPRYRRFLQHWEWKTRKWHPGRRSVLPRDGHDVFL